ncbi:hypothetical protein JXI42_09600 [bacterium]|nr:hypothetical protein [bacterium]
MIKIKSRKILDKDGREVAIQFEFEDYKKIQEYIEDIEDSLELAQAIKEADGFRLWEDFVAEFNSTHK